MKCGFEAEATTRRKASKFQAKKIVANQPLQAFVDKALLECQSPEAIAGRLKKGLEPGLPYVPRDTIEAYIASVHGRSIEYELKVLKAGHKRKNRKRRPTPKPGVTRKSTWMIGQMSSPTGNGSVT